MRRSGLLKRMKAENKAKTAAATWRNLMTACQMVTDAALLVEDGKTDPDYTYTREKVDSRLKQICGDDFTPWEERYRK